MGRNIKIVISMIIIMFGSVIPNVYEKKPIAHATENQGFVQQLNQLVNEDPILNGAVAGVSIRSASTGQLLYDHLGQVRLRPASNLKLLTATAALSTLGESFTFPTEVHTDGKVTGSTLQGNLFLKGKGDPTLLKKDFDEMATAIKKKGIKIIKGNLIGDDTWFDSVRLSKDLVWSDETSYYGAQISALTASPDKDYDAGTVIVEVTPSHEIGSQAKVRVVPETNYVDIVNHTVMVSPDSKKDIKIERKHGTNTIVIEGTLPIKSPKTREWIAVWEPTGYALDLFKQSLAKMGIKLEGLTKVGRTPEQTSLLAVHQSMPLKKLLIPFMKLSNNSHAEVLVKQMGKKVKGEGSWEKGLEVMRIQMQKSGLHTNSLVIRDGSGISHVDLIPANEITKLLYEVQKQEWFHSYLQSLPLTGEKNKLVGGTLRYRMKNAPVKGMVRAKTGTLSTVSSLSGYVQTQSGEKLIFSILLNNLIDESKGKQVEDKIVTLLANQ